MHRAQFLILALAALLLSGSLAVGQAVVSAQGDDPMAGTTVEVLGGGPSTLAADHNLVLLRITMVPGTAIPPHRHPGEVVVYVESGTFGTEFVDGSGTITRATTPGTPAATEPVTTGSDNTLEGGDSLAYDEAAAHTMVNAGEGMLVLLVSAVLDPSQPGFMFMDMSATPAP